MVFSLGKSALAGFLLAGVAASSSVVSSPRALNHSPNNVSASALINAAIEALGGREALASLKGVTYQSEKIFRMRSLMQNYNLDGTDRFIVSSGAQNVSFSLHEDGFYQRVDRTFTPSDYFIFTRPVVAPRDNSLVLKSGADGYACLTKGNFVVLLPQDQVGGYLESAMTEYLLLQALKQSPKLLLEIEKNSPVATTVDFRGVSFPAVHDSKTNITVLFDTKNKLPFVVRTVEDHRIRGVMTKDLYLFDYTEVNGLLFPQGQYIFFDGQDLVEETIVSKIVVDADYEEGFFDGLTADETSTTPSPPGKVPGYEHALLGEFWSNMLWPGYYKGTIGNAVSSRPAADLPGAHHLYFSDAHTISQLVLEFEDSVIVFEAPHHQAELVIQWVKENLGKPISHLWVSHHHHDHSLDVEKYVEIGASVIVPEMAVTYWSRIPGIKLTTITEDEPYIHSDSNMQARFIWSPHTPHSADMTYAVVTAACPSANSSMLAYVADSFSEGFNVDTNFVTLWLLQAFRDGLSRNATVVPAHGDPVPLSTLYEPLGSPYPPLNSTSFTRGGQACLASEGSE